MNYYKEQQRISLDYFRNLVAITVEYAEYRYTQGNSDFGVIKDVHHVGNLYNLYVYHGAYGTIEVTVGTVSGSPTDPYRVQQDLLQLQSVVEEFHTELQQVDVEQSWNDALRNAYLISIKQRMT